MTVELEEVEPGRWRVKRANAHAYLRTHLRADLPMPGVISDIMDPIEQVDGRFYTSKSQFRAVGRALGLTEVGNEKPKPRKKIRPDSASRRKSLEKAVERYKAAPTHEAAVREGKSYAQQK
jgi:hypothetical protein